MEAKVVILRVNFFPIVTVGTSGLTNSVGKILGRRALLRPGFDGVYSQKIVNFIHRK